MKLTNLFNGAAQMLFHGKKVAAVTMLTAAFSFQSFAQCTTASLNISTGMDATSGTPTAVAVGADDPKWIVQNITTDIRNYFNTPPRIPLPATPFPAKAVTANPPWFVPTATPPATVTNGWISFYNPGPPPSPASTWYETQVSTGTYAVTLRRYFKLCKEEELYIKIDGARDNYISNISLDGVGSLFSETISNLSTNFSTVTPLVNAVTPLVPAGTHYIEVTYNNYYAIKANPHAVYLVGSISTNSGIASIVTDACEDCDNVSETCSDKCYWKVEGNNINGNKNLFGTLTDNDVRVVTNKGTAGIPDRGVIKGGNATTGGFLGWNTTVPSARLHVNCKNGNNPESLPGLPSDIRFEDLEPGEGSVLVIDKDGYVYNSHVPVGQESPVAPEVMNMKEEIRELKMQLAELRQTLAAGSIDKYNTQVENELYQNSPNPFGKESSIGYNIVNMQQGAFIAVYDLNGKELFRQAVIEKGKGSITLSGDKLVPGMYLYSLIVDGKETATKRMVVTK